MPYSSTSSCAISSSVNSLPTRAFHKKAAVALREISLLKLMAFACHYVFSAHFAKYKSFPDLHVLSVYPDKVSQILIIFAHMADNYLEKKMEALQARKAKEQRARQIAWKKRMDAYRKKLQEQSVSGAAAADAGDATKPEGTDGQV